jgi:peptidylprolyl isomerase
MVMQGAFALFIIIGLQCDLDVGRACITGMEPCILTGKTFERCIVILKRRLMLENKMLATLILFAMILPFLLVTTVDAAQELTTASGLKVEILKQGSGSKAKAGQDVTVHYTGTLANGTKFDSSRDRGRPFTFNLGAGQVIKGWDEGIALLTVGSHAKLTVPSGLGYGTAGAGGVIPPNATLIFDVELLDAK